MRALMLQKEQVFITGASANVILISLVFIERQGNPQETNLGSRRAAIGGNRKGGTRRVYILGKAGVHGPAVTVGGEHSLQERVRE